MVPNRLHREYIMKKVLGTLLLIPLLLWMGIRIYRNISFDIDCGGHIKRAADANTVELATQEMKVVIGHLERNGMTTGYTSILYRTPNEDVGFWYTNLKSSLDELEKVKPEASQLERSNLLLKLRQTLLDHSGNQGEAVTKPSGISLFPNNVGYVLFGIIGLIAAIGSVALFLSDNF